MDAPSLDPSRTHHCPECGSAAIDAGSREGAVEHTLLSLVGCRPYRCRECGARFYDRRLGARFGFDIAAWRVRERR